MFPYFFVKSIFDVELYEIKPIFKIYKSVFPKIKL